MNSVLICNPTAGRRAARGRLDAAIHILENAGWEVNAYCTDGPGDATELARRAAREGAEAVLVAGGDGTINEAVQALAGSDIALGYLPYGTVNVWARELGMPMDVEAAARVLVSGRIEQIDLGQAAGRYFLLMASTGFDGEVLRRATSLERHKYRFGILPYVATGILTVPLYRGADFELRYDGVIRRVQALMLVVGNTRLYGGRFRLTPHAVANDGWLDVCIIKGRGPLSLVRQSLPLLLSGSVTFSDVELLRVKEMSVQADVDVPLQVDGELSAVLSRIDFAVAPGAVRAIVPKSFVSDLIA